MNCPFCIPDRECLLETDLAYAIYDKYPVNDGHVLIVSKRHCSDFFELTIKEQTACLSMVNEIKDVVSKRFNPDGFNVGINVGEKAGQTIDHVHIHLIPRYNGDMDDPRGGVRGVIPSKQKY